MKRMILVLAFGCVMGVVNARDLGAVLDHEEPLPHPASDQVQ